MRKIILLLSLFLTTLACFAQKRDNGGDHTKTKEEKKKERKERRQKEANTADEGDSFVEFVGNGEIQRSISEGAPIQANTGVGVVFNRIWKDTRRTVQNLELDLVINVASTADTIVGEIDNTSNKLLNRRSFGNYLLQPINSKQAVSLNFSAYFGNNHDDRFQFSDLISGVQGRLWASNSVWSYKQKSVNLSAYLLRIGIFEEVLSDIIRRDYDKRFSITFGMAYSWRGILGDIRVKENEQLRKDILGTDRTKFNGFEINFGFRLKNIRAEVNIPIIHGGDRYVPGLTNTQVVTSIRFVGGFPISLDPDKKKNEKPEE